MIELFVSPKPVSTHSTVTVNKVETRVTVPATLKPTVMTVIGILLLILWLISKYQHSEPIMASYDSENSSISSINDMESNPATIVSNRTNNNQLKHVQWKTRTALVQCKQCNKTLQLKWFNEHYITEHNNGKAIQYDTKMLYNVATKADGWKQHKYYQPKKTKAGSIQTKKQQNKNNFDIWAKNDANNSNNNYSNSYSTDNSDLHPDDRLDDE